MTAHDEIEALLGRVSSGDRRAFRKLYALTSAKLYGIALRILSDETLAQDVLEEVYTGVWEYAGHYRGVLATPQTWLVTITRDAAIARLSKERAEGRMTGAVEITDRLYAPRPDEKELSKMRAEAQALETCLRELPRARADMMRQAYLYGATYKDLAKGAGASSDNLRAIIRNDLIALRQCLSR